MGTFKVCTGVMNSAKTLRALSEIFNLELEGIRYLTMKSSQDTRDGAFITSRLIEKKAKVEIMIGPDDHIDVQKILKENYKYIIVDECHMLTCQQIKDLYKISAISNTCVSLYGLKMSYTGEPFPSISLALGYADKIEMVDKEDADGHLLTHHIKFLNGLPCDISEDVELIDPGFTEGEKNKNKNVITYKPVSKEDFYKIYGILNKI